MQAGGLDGRLPVFVFPQSLTFYLDDQNTHKQIVTLYNPYDFHMGYNILCNAPRRYMVDCPRGVIRPKCSLDIVVSHTDVSPGNLQAPDKLRFHIQEDGRSLILGRKDVPAQLVRGVPDPRGGSDTDRFESIQGSEHAAVGGYQVDRQRSNTQRQQEFGASQGRDGPNLIMVSAALVCILGLFMPTEGEASQSVIPLYLHLSASFKMAVAYALGMLTICILKAG